MGGFDYVLNVCGDHNFNDETCGEGSAVCERHRQSELATQVLGQTASTTWGWVDEQDGVYGQGSRLVMAMTGSACRSDNNSTKATGEIDFVCSTKEFVALRHAEGSTPAPVEDCNVGFSFYTAQACGAPRYECFNGTKCVMTTDYPGKHATFEGCRASCGDKPPAYDCVFSAANGFQCIEDLAGNFTNFGDCEDSCSLKAVGVERRSF